MRVILVILLGVSCVLSFIEVTQSDNLPQLSIEPRNLQLSAQDRRETLILCRLKDSSGEAIPLAGCQFNAYGSDHAWDFSKGAASPRIREGNFQGSYHGKGLRQGECGIAIANITWHGIFIFGCRVRPAAGGAWLYEKMMLLAAEWAPLQFNLDPPGVLLALPGSDVTINGRADQIIDGCVFVLPPLNNQVIINFNLGSASTNYSQGHYHGAGLERQECGLKLLNFAPEQSGFVQSWVHYNRRRVGGADFVELIVATAPEDPILTVNAQNRLSPGDTLQATCIVKNSRPVANITWYVGNDVVRNDRINEAPLDSKWRWDHDPQSIEQHLNYVVSASDRNKQLKCTSSHVALKSGPRDSQLFRIRVNRTTLTSTTTSPVPTISNNCGYPNPCGNNSNCEYTGIVYNCGCKEHYLGKPPNCRPQCVKDSDCAWNQRTCDGVRCVDACTYKKCGVNAECHMKNGAPVCKCDEGFVGQADVRCEDEIVPYCGQRSVSPPVDDGAQNATIEEFPWHVGLYALIDGTYKFVCGGTLIRRNIVVTAAHCVYSEARKKVQNVTELKVALGKLYKDYDGDAGSNKLQLVDAVNISVPRLYRGQRFSFRDDIAVVKLASLVQLSDAVNVACVDWSPFSLRDRFPKWAKINSTAAVGTVASWSKSDEVRSTALQLFDLVWSDLHTCYDETRDESQNLLTDDKFCATFTGQNVVCQLISGAGFMVPKDGKYYLRGVLGIHLNYPDRQLCNEERYAAFTAFHEHKDYLQTTLFD